MKVLDLLTQRSDQVFLWTHYFDGEVIAGRPDYQAYAPPAALDGSPYRGSKKLYPEAALSWAGFSGGPESYAIWLERDSLVGYFRDREYAMTIGFEQPDHVNGPALALCAIKSSV